jgi:hypothetical protein
MHPLLDESLDRDEKPRQRSTTILKLTAGIGALTLKTVPRQSMTSIKRDVKKKLRSQLKGRCFLEIPFNRTR